MRYRIKRVDAVLQSGGKLPTRYNVTFEELDADGKVLGEYIVGCESDGNGKDKVKAKISEFFKARAEVPPLRPPHPLEGEVVE